MKKVSIIAIVLLLGVSLSTQAQIKFGLRAGVNVNDLSLSMEDAKVDNIVGFQVGPVVEIGLLGIGAEAGILYNQKGGKLKFPTGDETFRNSYIDIPINLKYTFGILGIGAYATAGPYFSFALDGKDFNDVLSAGNELKDGDVSNFDIGLNFGLGVKLSKIGIGAQYGLGLSDVYSIPKDAFYNAIGKETKAKNKTISVLLTYYF